MNKANSARSRGPIIHCCPYKRMMFAVDWTDDFQSDILFSCRSTILASQASVLPAWVHVLHICKDLHENAWSPRRPQGTQLRWCITPDSTASFAIQPFLRDCIVSFDSSAQTVCSTWLFVSQFALNCEQGWRWRGEARCFNRGPRGKGRNTNEEWQRMPSSSVFLYFSPCLDKLMMLEWMQRKTNTATHN